MHLNWPDVDSAKWNCRRRVKFTGRSFASVFTEAVVHMPMSNVYNANHDPTTKPDPTLTQGANIEFKIRACVKRRPVGGRCGCWHSPALTTSRKPNSSFLLFLYFVVRIRHRRKKFTFANSSLWWDSCYSLLSFFCMLRCFLCITLYVLLRCDKWLIDIDW